MAFMDGLGLIASDTSDSSSHMSKRTFVPLLERNRTKTSTD